MPANLPSFQNDPIYAAAVLAANRDFQDTQGSILQNIQHGMLQLGNPQFARAFYANNWLRTPATRAKRSLVEGGAHGAFFRPGHPIRQITPFERAQLQAIRANANPVTGTSTFAQIGRSYGLQQEQLTNELNDANLFYSGYRGKKTGELGRSQQLEQANALYGAQTSLDQQLQQLTGARSARRDALTAAAQAAYTRLLAQRLGA